MKKDPAHPIFGALLREGALASRMLGDGATLLKAVSPRQTGALSIALFSLSIGLERAGKVAFVVDYRLENGARFPTDKELRDLGHDLERLYGKVIEIARRRLNAPEIQTLPTDPIHRAIITTLSEFARATRYYNLDLIVQNKNALLSHPEVAWFERVGKPILAKHYTANRRNRDAAFAADFGGALDKSGTAFRVLATSGDWVQSASELIQQEQETELVQRFAQFYTLQIIRFFANTLAGVQFAAHSAGLEEVPFFDELFAIFLNDDAYFKRRKTWRT